MNPELQQAASALEIDLDGLTAAAERTAEKLYIAKNAARTYLAEIGLAGSHHLDIVAFGSMAREEMAEGSDFDWLIVARRFSEDPKDFVHYKRAAMSALSKMGVDNPGPSGIFGIAVGGTELVNTIGLEHDTNLSHTRRILILEESVSLLENDRHRELKRAISARYLHDQESRRAHVPRFLLNDIVRYWRTVAVDYQAKRWKEVEGDKWGLRLLKLRSSRKLTYAGTLVSVMLPAIEDIEPDVDSLVEQWEKPSLARLAQLHNMLGEQGKDALRRVLQLADQFTEWLASDDLRTHAKSLAHPRDAEQGTQLHEAYLATRELNDALTDLFFCEEPFITNAGISMKVLTHRFLVF